MSTHDLGLPQTLRSTEPVPTRVTIWEVGARDGLQNESSVVPVKVKLEFLARLAGAGLSILEATSFVHPRWVPSSRMPPSCSTASPLTGSSLPGAGTQ